MQDFGIDSGNDLAIKNGDFTIVTSDLDHISDIIDFNQGELKEYPEIGVGIINYLNSTGKQQELNRKIRLMLESDGWEAKVIEQIIQNGVLIENVDI